MASLITTKPLEIHPNTAGVSLVVNPLGRIVTPIHQNSKFEAFKGNLSNILQKVETLYKTHPLGALLQYPEGELNLSKLAQAYNSSMNMGQASEGLCPFAVSAVLTQITHENPYSSSSTPLIVDNTEASLSQFAKDLSKIFTQTSDAPEAITYIPCRFDNNGRSHWVLIAIEKHEDKTNVTYINTRGGNHEALEPALRTLINQEHVIEKATVEHFGTNLVRNPNTPICLTTRSCGFDIIDISERLTEQAKNGHSISAFVSAGGLLQENDLALKDPEAADLANRTRCAEKFIDFLQSWNDV